jgi:serine/threonine protein kinase
MFAFRKSKKSSVAPARRWLLFKLIAVLIVQVFEIWILLTFTYFTDFLFTEYIYFLREFWFISPYCENGDLHDAIKRRKDQNNIDEININNQATRVKILLQISLAIQYIHTPVLKVRYVFT